MMTEFQLNPNLYSDAMKEIIRGLSKEASSLSDDELINAFSYAISDAIIQSTSKASEQEKLKNEFTRFISTILESTDPAMRGILKTLRSSTHELIQDAIREAEEAIASLRWQGAGGPGLAQKGVMEDQETIQARLLEGYNEAIDIINELSGAHKNFIDVMDDENSTALEQQSALIGVLDIMSPLAEEFDFAAKSVKNFVDENDNIDTNAVDDYIYSLHELFLQNEELQTKLPRIWNLLEEAIDSARYAIEDIIHTVNVFGTDYDVNAEQARQITERLAQSLWNLKDDAVTSLQLVADDGNTIIVHSANDIATAVEQKYISFANFITQITAFAGESAQGLAEYIAKLFEFLGAGQPFLPPAYTPPSPSGGGGGRGGKDPALEKIEDEIEDLRDEREDLQDELKDLRERIKDDKKALRDNWEKEREIIRLRIEGLKEQLKSYNEYIDAQKESLRIAKEEKDFRESLAEKNEDLARIQAELALLEGDNSEEAQRKRIELTEDASNIEEDIRKETEDRQYDLKIDALDRAQEAFEDNIDTQVGALEDLETKKENIFNAEMDRLDDLQSRFEDYVEAKLELIDDEIDRLNDMKEALQEIAGGGGGGASTGGWRGIETALKSYSYVAKQLVSELSQDARDMASDLGLSIDELETMAEKILKQGTNWEAAQLALENYIKKLSEAAEYNLPLPPKGPGGKQEPIRIHSGGAVGKGGFAGNLRSNEVFAKLLKGEYVATEGQMSNFLKNILPKLSSQIVPEGKHRDVSGGDVNLDVKIHVAGSLDKTVVPELSKEIVKGVNKALAQRGIRRNANNFSL
jgi:hypothetical protein